MSQICWDLKGQLTLELHKHMIQRGCTLAETKIATGGLLGQFHLMFGRAFSFSKYYIRRKTSASEIHTLETILNTVFQQKKA